MNFGPQWREAKNGADAASCTPFLRSISPIPDLLLLNWHQMHDRPTTDYEQWLLEQDDSYKLSAEPDYGLIRKKPGKPLSNDQETAQIPSGSRYGSVVTSSNRASTESQIHGVHTQDPMQFKFVLAALVLLIVCTVRWMKKRKRGIVLGTDM